MLELFEEATRVFLLFSTKKGRALEEPMIKSCLISGCIDCWMMKSTKTVDNKVPGFNIWMWSDGRDRGGERTGSIAKGKGSGGFFPIVVNGMRGRINTKPGAGGSLP